MLNGNGLPTGFTRYLPCCVTLLGLIVALSSHAIAQPTAFPPQAVDSQSSAVFHSGATTQSAVSQMPLGALPEERVNQFVYEQANRGVVHIATKSSTWDAFLGVSVREGSGSGSVMDRRGYIVTNQHVIDGAGEISVRLFNGKLYDAKLVGQDAETDIAVVKIEAPGDELFPIAWGNAPETEIGHRIYAIGNPFGLERTMTRGMVSSTRRTIASSEGRNMRSLIQIDAAVNQGNSGGPLLNTRAQLIGMNTAIATNSGGSEGIAFAIPVSTLRRVVPQLISQGYVTRATIGISRVYEIDRGLLVVTVTRGGPAELAGLQGFRVIPKTFDRGGYKVQQLSLDPSQADMIISIDGQAVRTADELLAAIHDKQPGDVASVRIIRQGETLDIPVRLGGQ